MFSTRALIALGFVGALLASAPEQGHAQSRGRAVKAQRVGPQKTAKAKAPSHRPSAKLSTHKLRALPAAKATTRAPSAESKALVDGLAALHQKKVDGISIPHADVIKQIEKAAGGPVEAPIYVIRYGTPAAEQVTSLTGQSSLGLMYKGSAGNGHSMITVGDKFTDAVPGRHSFSNGQKTRLHQFEANAERPQITALYALPKGVMGKAVDNAVKTAEAKKSCGADCAGYVREIAVKTAEMAKEAGSTGKVTELSKAIGSYQAPTRLRNTSFAHADAIILMVSKHDWRNPNNAGYDINDWNKKK